jgi:hypothetical protein
VELTSGYYRRTYGLDRQAVCALAEANPGRSQRLTGSVWIKAGAEDLSSLLWGHKRVVWDGDGVDAGDPRVWRGRKLVRSRRLGGADSIISRIE